MPWRSENWPQLGQKLYFNSTWHVPALLNQQLSSNFNTEVCLHRLVVLYWYAFRDLWGKQGNGEIGGTSLTVKDWYSPGWEELLKNVVSQPRHCSGCGKGGHQLVSTSCWRVLTKQFLSSIRSFLRRCLPPGTRHCFSTALCFVVTKRRSPSARRRLSSSCTMMMQW